MQFIRLSNKHYPVKLKNIQLENRGTIFPKNPSNKQLKDLGYARVESIAPPQNNNKFLSVREIQPVEVPGEDGVSEFFQAWELVPADLEQTKRVCLAELSNAIDAKNEVLIRFKGKEWTPGTEKALLVNGKADLLIYSGQDSGYFIDANKEPVLLTVDEMKQLAVKTALAYDDNYSIYAGYYNMIMKAKDVDTVAILFEEIKIL